MNLYKVNIENDVVASCDLMIRNAGISGGCFFEHDKNHLIFAFIEADTEDDATEICNKILEDFTEDALKRA